MRYFLSVLFLFLLTGPLLAQVQDVVKGNYTPGFYSQKNYVKNPGCFANTRNISTSGTGSVTRITSGHLEGNAGCQISGSSSADKVIFSLNDFEPVLKGQNCEIVFNYSGVGTKWKVYAERNSVRVGSSLQLESTYDSEDDDYDTRPATLPFPCGDLTSDTSIVFEATDSLPSAVALSTIYGGRIINLNPSSACDDVYCETEFSAFVTDGSSTTTVSEETLGGWIEGNCTNPVTGTYVCTFSDGIFTVPPHCWAMVSGQKSMGYTLATSSQVTVAWEDDGGSSQDRDFTLYCKKQGTDHDNAKANSQGSVYSTSTSTNSNWQSCGHTTSDFTGFGTVTNIETQCKRNGSDLLMRGKFTVGTPVASEARIGLNFQGETLTSAGASAIASLQKAGDGSRNTTANANNDYNILLAPSVSYFTIALKNLGGTNALASANGNALVANGEIVSFTARAPISGWENSNVIIGSFKEVVTTPGVSRPVSCNFKVAVDGAVSNEKGDCVNGSTCSLASSTFTCPFNSGFFNGEPNCNITLTARGFVDGYTSSSSALEFTTKDNAEAIVARPSVIECNGGAP